MTASPRRTPTRAAVPNLPGHFYYADLNTTDVDGACTFYTEMFGWRYNEIDGAPNRYLPANIDGREKVAIAGLAPETLEAGVPPHWLPYLWVDDVDRVCAHAVELGGSVVVEAMDVFDMGRLAILVDPTGAHFGIWHDAQAGETTVKDEHGSAFWFELQTNDLDRALAFYRDLVGWTTDPRPMGEEFVYHLLVPVQSDEQQVFAGGAMKLMQQDLDMGVPSAWYPYFQVDDCDAAFVRALELGGSPIMQPHDIPGTGRSCWVQDPQGAYLPLMYPDPEFAGEQP